MVNIQNKALSIFLSINSDSISYTLSFENVDVQVTDTSHFKDRYKQFEISKEDIDSIQEGQGTLIAKVNNKEVYRTIYSKVSIEDTKYINLGDGEIKYKTI